VGQTRGGTGGDQKLGIDGGRGGRRRGSMTSSIEGERAIKRSKLGGRGGGRGRAWSCPEASAKSIIPHQGASLFRGALLNPPGEAKKENFFQEKG